MKRFLTCGTLAACVLGVLGAAGAAAADVSRRQRRRPRLRHRHGSRRPARHDAHAGQLRGPRRGQAAADHPVRQHAAADPADRHARRLGQHGGQPAAAARRRGAALRAASRGRRRAGRRVRTARSRSARRSRTIRRSSRRRCRRRSRPTRRRRSGARIDQAMDAFGDDGRPAQGDPRAERRQGHRRPISFRQHPASQARGHRSRAPRGRDDLRDRHAQPQPRSGCRRASARAACRRCCWPTCPIPGLARVAEETGGGYIEIRFGQDLGAAFAGVADELHTQYLLGFAPPKRDGKVHDIDVRVDQARREAARAQELRRAEGVSGLRHDVHLQRGIGRRNVRSLAARAPGGRCCSPARSRWPCRTRSRDCSPAGRTRSRSTRSAAPERCASARCGSRRRRPPADRPAAFRWLTAPMQIFFGSLPL